MKLTNVKSAAAFLFKTDETRSLVGLSVPLAAFCTVVMLALPIGEKSVLFVSLVILALLFAVLMLTSLLLGKRGRRITHRICALLLAVLLGILVALHEIHTVREPAERILSSVQGSTEDASVIMEIDSVAAFGESFGIYDGRIITIDGKNARDTFGAYSGVRLYAFGSDPLAGGEIVEFIGTVSRPKEISDSGFEERRYLEGKGIFITAEANSSVRLIAVGRERFFEGLRRRLSKGLGRYIPDSEMQSLARCILLGEREGVSNRTLSLFRACGASHILCVSGMHLTILFCAVSAFLRLGQRKRRRFPTAEAVSCFVALVYMAITDFTPSIMRAGLMLIFLNVFSFVIYYRAKLSTRSSFAYLDAPLLTDVALGGLTALLLALSVICVLSPYAVYDIGMQLSALSTLGIIVSLPILSKILPRVGASFLATLLCTVTATLFAVAFTLPVSIPAFGEISSMSVPSNVLLSVIITPLLVLLLALSLLSLLPAAAPVTVVCTLLGRVCGFLCSLCHSVCESLSGSRFSLVNAKTSTTVMTVLAVICILSLSACILSKKRLAALIGSFAVIFYSVILSVSLVNGAREGRIPSLRIHTVSKNPYACVSLGSTRTVLDGASALYSEKHLFESLGSPIYNTDGYYAFIPSDRSDIECIPTNLEVMSRLCDVRAVLLPSPRVCGASGIKYSEYRRLCTVLSDSYTVFFYDKTLHICGIDFAIDTYENGRSVKFLNYSLVFSKNYSESLAEASSIGSDCCIYLCKNAKKTDNEGYTSGVPLYVTSSEVKKIKGALALPSGSSEVFEVLEKKTSLGGR